ncbi:MAG: LON peptidase substrate-binding domain-containing protein [Anaerolineae bacterium]|jgi:Lon protease-like protein|nr:LON peptidase substrate-binding domain-containing protein [Anaerolineae bacterium]
MVELPLFPLNSVLFPGMPLQLHIFEERYKLMINECIDKQSPFGVVLIESGAEALGPLAKPHIIGCSAGITRVQRLPFGRMNIVAKGMQRFRIHEMHQHKAYLTGEVEFIPLHNPEPVQIDHSARRLNGLLRKYLLALENAGQLNFDESQLPDDPIDLAYLAAVILQTEAPHKQRLLAAENALSMIHDLNALYHREVALLHVMLSNADITNGDTTFSLN